MGELNNRLKLILEVAREQSNLPILVKLGQIHDMAGTLDALADAKVNGLVAFNTQTNYVQFKENLTSSDYALLEKYTSEFNGGLSGAAIRSFARDKMKEARAYINKHALDLSLVHVGGIASPEDIVESRSFAELREWYSCFLSALASQDPRQIYQAMTEKK